MFPSACGASQRARKSDGASERTARGVFSGNFAISKSGEKAHTGKQSVFRRIQKKTKTQSLQYGRRFAQEAAFQLNRPLKRPFVTAAGAAFRAVFAGSRSQRRERAQKSPRATPASPRRFHPASSR
jgi:hypothetical protein